MQYIIDILIYAVVTVIVALVLTSLFPNERGAEEFGVANSAAVALTLIFAVAWHATLFVAWPNAHEGQTLGMRAMNIRVVRIDGGLPNLGQYVTRWILLIVDGALAGLVGLLTMALTQRNQRLGDLAAGTLVVRVPRTFAHVHIKSQGVSRSPVRPGLRERATLKIP